MALKQQTIPLIFNDMSKKQLGVIIPVQPVWLDTKEACKYLNVSANTFKDSAIINGIGAYRFGKKVVYNIHEINESIKSNPLIKKM